jgi:hypothetical protein
LLGITRFELEDSFRRLRAPLRLGVSSAEDAFGTPVFLISQTVLVGAWIAGNIAGLFHFDLYPFILLNLAFSTQAAYAAPPGPRTPTACRTRTAVLLDCVSFPPNSPHFALQFRRRPVQSGRIPGAS